MSKFHVGDRVRIFSTDSVKSWLNNRTGVVSKVMENSNVYHVALDNSAGTFWFVDNELRPADIFAWAKDEPSAIQEAVDVVNHPPHYNRFPVEVINITEQLDFNRGNAVKYLARAGFKEGVDELEDLSKAAWYVNRAIEKLKKEREDG